MSADGVTVGGGAPQSAPWQCWCVCPRVSVYVYKCVRETVCIQLILVMIAGLTLALPFPHCPSYSGLCHLHPSGILHQYHRCGFTRCRFPGRVINDSSCGPSHSPSLPDLVLPLLFPLACLHHSLRREINVQGQGGGEDSGPVG